MSIPDELEKLKTLLDSGALSEEDYQKAKDRVLAGEPVPPTHSSSSGSFHIAWSLPVVGLLLFLPYFLLQPHLRGFGCSR